MTPKTYLNQAYRLEQRIRLDTEELENLRTLAATVLRNEISFFNPGLLQRIRISNQYNPAQRACREKRHAFFYGCD